MTDETEDDKIGLGDIEVDTYEPIPVCVADGDVMIPDPAEFSDLTGSIAAQVRDGALFVLSRDSLKWVNVEAIKRPKAASVASIK